MVMDRSTPAVKVILRCLLLLWMFFGGLELAEQLHVVPESVAEDQEGQDLDEEALSQLASGLKSDVPSLSAPGDASVIIAVAEATSSISSFTTARQLEQLTQHDPPALPLYQQLCVYRI
jgi:hypothetical protein